MISMNVHIFLGVPITDTMFEMYRMMKISCGMEKEKFQKNEKNLSFESGGEDKLFVVHRRFCDWYFEKYTK